MTTKVDEATARPSGRDEAGLTPAQRTWLEHMKQCEAEGLTYKAYCQREGLKVGGLYAARKVLRAGVSVETPSNPPPRFAAVRLAHEPSGRMAQLVLANGVQLHVTLQGVDDVVQLVQSLMQLPR